VSKRRHSWDSLKRDGYPDDVAFCRNCGLRRDKEFLEPTLYTLPGDRRAWNRAPNCPPDADDPGRVLTDTERGWRDEIIQERDATRLRLLRAIARIS
jgi:hypothetical protein